MYNIILYIILYIFYIYIYIHIIYIYIHIYWESHITCDSEKVIFPLKCKVY